MMENYFGTRRKRNIDMSRFNQQRETNVHSIDNYEQVLEEEYEYDKGYEEIEVEETVEVLEEDDSYRRKQKPVEHNSFPLMIDGKPFIPKQITKKESFHESHIRITTYLEKNVHQIIRMLQNQGQIESITSFVNESIKEHLMNKYHNN